MSRWTFLISFLVFLLGLNLGCSQSSFETKATYSQTAAQPQATPNPNTNTSYKICASNTLTSESCLVEDTGTIVTDTFGSDVISWSNTLASTTVSGTLSNGYYLNHQIRFQDNNLIASNIKEGVNIFGVTGTFQTAYSDCTLDFASPTLSLCTAPLNSFITTGSGNHITTWTNSGGGTSVSASIPDGYYKSKAVYFTEPQLLSQNILSSATLFGVVGSATLAHSSCANDSLNLSPCSTSSQQFVTSSTGVHIFNWTNTTGTTSIIATIPTGFYNSQYISLDDSNLISANIISGTSIFGVTGSAEIKTYSALSFTGVSSVTEIGSTTAIVNWSGVSNVISYFIYDANTNPHTLLATASGSSNQFKLTNLISNTNYKIRVKALNNLNQEDTNSSEVSITTLSSFTPKDISNLYVWFESSGLAGYNNDDPLTSWNDSGLNGYNLTQSSSTLQPLVKTNILNGYPVVDFDGVDDYISFSPPYYDANDFTVFAVAKPTASHQIDTESTATTDGISGQRYLFEAINAGTLGGVGISFGTNGISVYEHTNSYMPPTNVVSATSTTFRVISFVYSSKSPSIYLDGVFKRTGLTSPKYIIYAPRALGKTSSYGAFMGQVAEVLIYTESLNSTDRQNVENYLKTKYGL